MHDAAYQQAEASALGSADVVPLLWGVARYEYDVDTITAFPVQVTGLVSWERAALAA